MLCFICFMLYEIYQNLPQYIDPIAFSIGSFSVRWYSVSYIFGFALIYILLIYRIKNEIKGDQIFNFKLPSESKDKSTKNIKQEMQNMLLDILMISFMGALIGGRMVYVFVYNFAYFFNNPIQIISPFDPISGKFEGIYGMSYHGALAGALLFSWMYCKIKKFNFKNFLEFIIPAIPAGYFFGRIGNFLNKELIGRETTSFWGMYFDSKDQLYLPSQLFEAFFEGLILFVFLWLLKNNKKTKGKLFCIYLFGYGAFRFIVEYLRQPDPQLGFVIDNLTMGQLLSLAMIFLSIKLFFEKEEKSDILKSK